MKSFQIVVLGIFIFLAVLGMIFFARSGRSGGGSSEPVSGGELWGTLDSRVVDTALQAIRDNHENFDVSYRQIPESLFEQELIEALASEQGPDMMLLPQDLIARQENKVLLIPFTSYPERTFKDTFIEGGELYLTAEGIVGLPFSVDPLVMYWNRTLFTNNGIAQPPRFWDELFEIVPRIARRDQAGGIQTAAISLGGFSNIDNAKEIVSALLMQSGSSIVERATSGTSRFNVTLRGSGETTQTPAVSALRFFTEFGNPAVSSYSWNRSLRPSQELFVSGDLGMYLGFASELFALRDKNPNLNFDIIELPQVRDGGVRKTFGRIHALSILKGTDDLNAAVQAVFLMTSAEGIAAWRQASGLPPVRRDLLIQQQEEAFETTFYTAALTSDSFFDPDPQQSEAILQKMVEDTISGRKTLSEAVRSAQEQFAGLTR